MIAAIEFERVTKRYGRSAALDDVSFTCPAGTITAFCGPNGAGKSTALRVLTGISRADSGRALVLGSPVRELDDPARSIGSLLDASAFHPGRTVRETVRLAAFSTGLPRRRADECLEMVGLSTVASRRVGRLSLGMRQRLGLAHALVGRPAVLVLDEPSNGLDPDGMMWLEAVLRRFTRDGGTVLLSTHHLAAAQRTADRVVAISRGRTVDQVDMAQLTDRRTVVRAADPDGLQRALSEAGLAATTGPHRLLVEADPGAVGRVARDAGVALLELRSDDVRLDEYLAARTQGEFTGVTA